MYVLVISLVSIVVGFKVFSKTYKHVEDILAKQPIKIWSD
jgi:hypothetical protein